MSLNNTHTVVDPQITFSSCIYTTTASTHFTARHSKPVAPNKIRKAGKGLKKFTPMELRIIYILQRGAESPLFSGHTTKSKESELPSSVVVSNQFPYKIKGDCYV